jgi:hypothetical protein
MKNIDMTKDSAYKRQFQKFFSVPFVAVVGYIVSFFIIFIAMEIADISGWYVVYIPFFALIGAVFTPIIWFSYKKSKT